MVQLPLFPVKLVLFPNEKVNIHIFEPRYKSLIKDCRKNEIGFGIVLFKDDKLFSSGTEARVQQIFKTYADGRMDIQLIGNRRFKIIKSYSNLGEKEYGGADIEWLPVVNQKNEVILLAKVAILLEELYKLLKIERNIYAPDGKIYIHELVHYIGLSLEQEHELLSINTEEGQWTYIHEFLINMISAISGSIMMRKKVAMNGAFKNLDSPINF